MTSEPATLSSRVTNTVLRVAISAALSGSKLGGRRRIGEEACGNWVAAFAGLRSRQARVSGFSPMLAHRSASAEVVNFARASDGLANEVVVARDGAEARDYLFRTGEYKNETPPEGLAFPEIETPAHAANLGMTFYTGTKFPAKYGGGIFFAQHGSWNRSVPIGARISFASLKPDGTGGKAEVFTEGWLNEMGAYDGHPVDVAELADGSLIVSDDYAGALYRIAYEE